MCNNLNFQLYNWSIKYLKSSIYSEFYIDFYLLSNDLSQFCAFQNCKKFHWTNTYTLNHSATPSISKSELINWISHMNANHLRVSNISEKDVVDWIIREVCIYCNKLKHFMNQFLNVIALNKPFMYVNTALSVDKQEQGKEDLSF